MGNVGNETERGQRHDRRNQSKKETIRVQLIEEHAVNNALNIIN